MQNNSQVTNTVSNINKIDYDITIDKVNFAYDSSKPILTDISLKIPRGSSIAIMGGSGSGKTTLLRLILGQIKAQQGTVNLLGQQLELINKKTLLQLCKQIGVLFQFGALFTDMSVAQNVAFMLNEHTKLTKAVIDKIVAMKLQAVGLFGTQNLAPQELSGGMARRVALARAIALDPELMIYDEPFTGLDPISVNVIAMLIKHLQQALKQTMVLVTHNIEISLKIVDYVYFMAHGKIVFAGTPDEVLHTTDQAVQQFIKGKVEGPFNYRYETSENYLC